MISLLLLFLACLFFALRVPVSIAMALATLIAFVAAGIPLRVVASQMVFGVDSYALLAVPFFVYAGNVMNVGGITERIFTFARALFGWMTGGLAQVNVAASVIFAGMSGSALADLAGLGAVEMRAMRENGYPAGFSAGITLASCTIGPIVPPSIILVIYALATDTSVGRLFLAGIGAGLVIAACLMVHVYIHVKRTRAEWGRPERFSGARVRLTAREGLPAILAPVVILAALAFGVTTPSELGAVASLYALMVALWYRSMDWAKLWQALTSTVTTTAVIMLLFAVAGAMNFVIARERVAHEAAIWMAEAVTNPVLGILAINLFLVVIGMFLEGPIAILVIAPILIDVVAGYGMDPVTFGVMLSFNVLIGMITPPVGIGLFVGARVAGITPERTLRATMPFLVPLFVGLAIIAFVPAVTLWLPGLVMGP
ncbi:TRAP transporter large permease [Jannaschia sp. LMIT008]|uniref:TRAP transporter large permease n=1 Tax=Jannaschia maritima TaxID=3032585 RepID=UPI0028117B7D|nr:TRAP transporter large permease [Jannaschia sp. LMIT008]